MDGASTDTEEEDETATTILSEYENELTSTTEGDWYKYHNRSSI